MNGQCPRRHPEHGDACHKLENGHLEHHNLATGRKWSDTDYQWRRVAKKNEHIAK
jgi:hypothetical protein